MFRTLILAVILGSLFCGCVIAQASKLENGIYLYQEGKYSEAVEVLRSSIATEKPETEMWTYLLFSYLKLGDEQAANEAFASYQTTKFNPPFVKPKTYDKGPRILDKPKAEFTDEARRAGIRGESRLLVEFQADGKVGTVYPIRPLSHGLTENAIKAAKKIRFEPAIRNGKPVSVLVHFSYNFGTR